MIVHVDVIITLNVAWLRQHSSAVLIHAHFLAPLVMLFILR